MSRTQNTKNIFFLIGCVSSSLDCFSIIKNLKVTRIFSSTLNFAWQFTYQWNRWRAILPQTQICKLGRTKFDTHTVLSRDEGLISFKILPFQVFLSPWRSTRKVQLCLLRDLAFHLQNCRIQQKLHETHKICLWLERIRSSHIKGIRLSVIQFNRKYHETHKMWHPSEQNYFCVHFN